MRRELVELQKNLGVTTVYVTHDQTEALTMADRLVVIKDGFVRQIGTVDEVYNHPADTFVASFIGTPKINLVEGWISEGQIKPFRISQVFVPSDYEAGEIIVGIRPEDIIIDPEGRYNASIRTVEYLGDRSIITARYMDCNITLTADPGQFQPDDNIKFTINTDKVHLFNKETGESLARRY